MAASTIAFMIMAFMTPRRNRIFHYITASITLVASIAYFTMASNLGYAAIPVEFPRTNSVVSAPAGWPAGAPIYREIFYVRYIDWFVTTPVRFADRPMQEHPLTAAQLLLMDLLLTAGLPWPTILYTVSAASEDSTCPS